MNRAYFFGVPWGWAKVPSSQKLGSFMVKEPAGSPAGAAGAGEAQQAQRLGARDVLTQTFQKVDVTQRMLIPFLVEVGEPTASKDSIKLSWWL